MLLESLVGRVRRCPECNASLEQVLGDREGGLVCSVCGEFIDFLPDEEPRVERFEEEMIETTFSGFKPTLTSFKQLRKFA